MAYILASLGIIAGWLVYRSNIVSKRKSYLVAIEELLKTVEKWFGTSYAKEMDNPGWRNPNYMVYKVDIDIVKPIITEGGFIFGEIIIRNLIQFLQLVTRFNQYVDLHLTFVHSNFDKIFVAKDKQYLEKTWMLMRLLHTEGIGSGYHGNSDYPYLSQCFDSLRENLKEESNNNVRLLCWKKFILGDITFFIVPIFIITISILKSIN